MNTKGFLARAIDSDAFVSTDAYATVVNPKIWDSSLRDYEEKMLVYTNHVTTFDFRQPGRDYTVTIDAAPTAAADVAETDAVSIQPITNRQVTFIPTERGSAMQTTRKELVRAFFPVMENMTKKLAYSLALKKDALGVSVAQAGATTALVAHDVASTAIAPTDTLGLEDFTKANRVIKNYYYRPVKAFICPSQEEQILNISQLQKANEFGSRSAIDEGLVGQLFGIKIYVSDSIPVATNKAKMLVQGESKTGEQAVGYAIKRDAMIERDYDPFFRAESLIAHEEYDFKVLHPNAIVTVESYAA